MTERDTLRLRKVAERIKHGCRLLRSWPLTGGVSAQVNALELQLPDGETRKLVMRVHGERDRQHNPQVAAHEFRLLQVLQSAYMPSPAPIYLDQSCEVLPHPYLVVEYIEGDTECSKDDQEMYLRQLACHLARTHSVEPSSLQFLPRLADQVSELLSSYSIGQDYIIQALKAAWPWSSNKQVLLHGDYWPGNVLWQRGKLVGIIDWEDAKLGDPLADLANTRLELLWALGVEAVDSFTRHYCSIADIDLTNLPFWDLWVALRKTDQLGGWGLDGVTERRMRAELDMFTKRALDELGYNEGGEQ